MDAHSRLYLLIATTIAVAAIGCIGASVNWWLSRGDARQLDTPRGRWIVRSVRIDDLVRVGAYAFMLDRGLASWSNAHRAGFLISADTWRSSRDLAVATVLFAFVSMHGWWRRWLLMSGRK